jgi:Ner family transcriptional regulator
MSPTKWDNPAIKAELERRGWTLTRLALENGLHESACRRALHSSCHAGAMVIAKALGVTLEELFPGRYIRRRVEQSTKSAAVASPKSRRVADKGVAA